MESVLTRLRSLSADELRAEFLKVDLKCGAITATTRSIFERKLARALLENGGPESPAQTEESEVGYHMGLNPPEEEPLSQTDGATCQSDPQTPSRSAQVSPACYYGVCPLWEDVLARNGETPPAGKDRFI